MRKLMFLCVLLSVQCFGQRKCKKVAEKIYATAINYNFSGKGRNIVMTNITDNTDIKSLNFGDLLKFNPERRIKLWNLDSTWIPIILKADYDKNRLLQYKIRKVKIDGLFVVMRDRDSVTNIGYSQVQSTKTPYYVDSKITVSSIIFHRNKAIVSLTRQSGPLDGEAVVYFLEKKMESGFICEYLESLKP